MSIILTPFEKALASLELALKQPKNEFIRDAVIQRFEYTYELAWKMLKRFLIEDIGAESVNLLSRKDMFRVAADKGFLTDPQAWFFFHQARDLTSQTYDEQTAEATYNAAVAFFPQAIALMSELVKRND